MARKNNGLAEYVIDRYRNESIPDASIPDYLEKRYWWAYLHPTSVYFFEKQWVVNTILWGNYTRLRDAVLDEMGETISGRTLQVACVYGNLTPKLVARNAPDSRMYVVDAAPIQLENLARKLDDHSVFLDCQDASQLTFETASFDQVLIFFLLHELPLEVRRKAVKEALRVLKPNGKLIFVDYHRPVPLHPHRYIMPLIFKTLEPFAMDLWKSEIAEWVPADRRPRSIEKTTYFGGLYQKVVMRL